ncbi:MAG: hypothetical protein OXC94_11985 [Chloroflexi bacterium]|nr:hypothetical protein [Chloroflexota bacterium]
MPSRADAAASGGALDPRIPEWASAAALAYLSALVREVPHIIEAADHSHLSRAVGRRFTEEGAQNEHSVSVELLVCPGRECRVDDGGIRSWKQWAGDRGLHVLKGSDVRSDEEMAAAAIRAVIPEANIAKRPQDMQRRADFCVVLPDGRSVDVEATMHTDGDRRAVSNARSRRAVPGLENDWHVVVRDNRYLNDYSGDNAFSVNEVRKVLAEVLARVENGEFGPADDARIEAMCEQQIAQEWRWTLNDTLESEPPLKISILGKEPSGAGDGSLHITTATSVSHFSRVTDASAVASAVQQSIDHKLERDQWDSTADSKWLVVVLDEGKATTQLRGVTEFDDALLDSSDITFPGLDEVWVVAFADGRLTALRCTGAGSRWRLYRNLDIQPQLEAG